MKLAQHIRLGTDKGPLGCLLIHLGGRVGGAVTYIQGVHFCQPKMACFILKGSAWFCVQPPLMLPQVPESQVPVLH